MRCVFTWWLAASLTTACQPSGEAVTDPESASVPAGAVTVVSLDRARSIATARVPGGAIDEAELETEDGVEAYSIDIVLDGSEIEVRVDPRTGAVLSVRRDGREGDDADDVADEEDEDEGDDDGDGGALRTASRRMPG